jgi:hypothetical protein
MMLSPDQKRLSMNSSWSMEVLVLPGAMEALVEQ